MALKTGDEAFHNGHSKLDLTLLDFWRWSSSDISNNALRGQLAEFIVASALGLTDSARVEWDACDLRTADGLRVEVKSAAYWQSWPQKAPSKIIFKVARRLGWDAATNTTSAHAARNADVFVFCILAELDRERVDPMQMNQWQFYVVAAHVLNAQLGKQKSLGLGRLREIARAPVAFEDLAHCVSTALTRADNTPF